MVRHVGCFGEQEGKGPSKPRREAKRPRTKMEVLLIIVYVFFAIYKVCGRSQCVN